MKKWLPAIFILAAALIFFGVISLPHTGLPHSRAESLQWDGGSRPMTAGESDVLAERLAGGAVCLTDPLQALCDLTGEDAADATIDEVFETFCVGK